MVESALSPERKRLAAFLEPLPMLLVGAFVLPVFDLQAVVAG